MVPTCLCGQPMVFPVGRDKTNCRTEGCGVKWERDQSGYWAIGLTRIQFTPTLTIPIIKPKRFRNYEKWLRKNKGGKEGARC